MLSLTCAALLELRCLWEREGSERITLVSLVYVVCCLGGGREGGGGDHNHVVIILYACFKSKVSLESFLVALEFPNIYATHCS